MPSAVDMKFGIVVSEWNEEITEALYEGAYNTLIENGAKPENIVKKYVPGSFELTKGGKFLAEYSDVDAVICLGCIGESFHYREVISS